MSTEFVAWLALAGYLVALGAAFGWRAARSIRETGDAGFRGFSGRVGSPEWWGGALFGLSLLGFLVSPLLVGLGVLPALTEPGWLTFVGAALTLVGIAALLWAQATMGASWRIGVDASEKTELVTAGPFALVRNPVFSAMMLASAGLTLTVPTWVGILSVIMLIVGIQLQVRFTEEPYLLATHGPGYRTYAASAGRFIPGVGRLSSQSI